MGRNRTGLDRLLPRHVINVEMPLKWDVRRARRLVGRGREVSESGCLLNLSLEGALVEVALPTERVVGDRLIISMGDNRRGEVVIRHSRIAKSGDRALYGISFINAPALGPIINGLVSDARGNATGLTEAWNRAK